MDAAKKTRLAEALKDAEVPAAPDADGLEDLVQEIQQDAVARAGSYPRDAEVPEGGE